MAYVPDSKESAQSALHVQTNGNSCLQDMKRELIENPQSNPRLSGNNETFFRRWDSAG